MKIVHSSLLRAFLAVVIGILLVVYSEDAMGWLTKTIGILFFLSGMEGRMLAPLGISFIVALVASTVVALTLTPVLSSYLLGKQKKDDKPEKEPYVVRKLKNAYEKALKWTLSNRKWVLGGTGALLTVTIVIFFNFLLRIFVYYIN